MILPALLLTLDKYSSWRVGRVVPIIRSAVRTTLRSLLRSDLVAELNQTVIHCSHSAVHDGEWGESREVSPEVHDHLHCFEHVKGIVHFEIKIWYLSAYPKGIQDVGVFFSSVDPILMFLGQTVLVCQSYNGRYRSLSL